MTTTVELHTKYIIPENTENKTGYTFDSYNTEKDGKGTKYMPGESVVIEGDFTLYRQWIPNPQITSGTYHLSCFNTLLFKFFGENGKRLLKKDVLIKTDKSKKTIKQGEICSFYDFLIDEITDYITISDIYFE